MQDLLSIILQYYEATLYLCVTSQQKYQNTGMLLDDT